MMDIRQLVEDYLLNNRRDKNRDHKVFYASELGTCPVKVFFSIVRPQPTELRALKIFRVGDLVHQFIQELAETKGAQSEVPVRAVVDEERGIELHGRVDLLYEGEPYEIKSAKKIPERPYLHHIAQLNAYLNLLDSDVGYIIYVEKNTFDIAQYPVFRDFPLWEQSIRRIQAIHDAVEAFAAGEDWLKYLRPHVPQERWECRYCIYRSICPLAEETLGGLTHY